MVSYPTRTRVRRNLASPAVIGFSRTDWRHPDISQLIVVSAVPGEVLSAVLAGMTVDELKEFATTRGRATAVEMATWVPVSVLMYLFSIAATERTAVRGP